MQSNASRHSLEKAVESYQRQLEAADRAIAKMPEDRLKVPFQRKLEAWYLEREREKIRQALDRALARLKD